MRVRRVKIGRWRRSARRPPGAGNSQPSALSKSISRSSRSIACTASSETAYRVLYPISGNTAVRTRRTLAVAILEIALAGHRQRAADLKSRRASPFSESNTSSLNSTRVRGGAVSESRTGTRQLQRLVHRIARQLACGQLARTLQTGALTRCSVIPRYPVHTMASNLGWKSESSSAWRWKRLPTDVIIGPEFSSSPHLSADCQ
jgi:hypothetical protein